MDTRKIISHLIIMGDSLSDRGTLFKKKLFGFIPMGVVSGIKKISPDKSFTNGYTWSNHFIASLANEFTIKKLETEYNLKKDDIADGIITHDKKITNIVNEFYNLKNDLYVNFHQASFARVFAEGGLTAHSHKCYTSTNIKHFFARLILSTLEDKRTELFADDFKHRTTKLQKKQTLILEWSGANDFITVCKKPTMAAVDKIVNARIKNISELIKHGYQNFIIFNIPNLLLTPRLQNANKEKQKNATLCCEYLNKKLELACRELQTKHALCTIKIFDVNDEFTKIYNNAEKFGFDKNKLSQPFIKSIDFKMNADKKSPSDGYMFWDDVHPSADTHAILADVLINKLSLFHFKPPQNAANDPTNTFKMIKAIKNKY